MERWWERNAGAAYSLVTGLAVASLALAMQTDAYRKWYKAAFKPWDFTQYLTYYGLFLWAPLCVPVLAAGFFPFFSRACRAGWPRPREHVWIRKGLPPITGMEAVAYALIVATALVWVGAKVRRSVDKYGWTTAGWLKIAEALGIGSIPLLTFLLIPSHATRSALTWLHMSPERAVEYHKWVGAFAFVLVAAHGAMFFPLYYIQDGWMAIRLVFFSSMTCTTHSKCIPAGLFAVGVAVFFLFFATYWQRRLNWRRFRAFHVLGAPLFYIGAVAHWQKFVWYLTPGVALHMAKVACRLHQHCFTVEASVFVREHPCSNSVRVPELPRENSQRASEIFEPGNAIVKDERVCLHLKLPRLSGHTHVGQWLGIGVASGWRLIPPEIHPATVVTSPGEQAEVCLLLRRESAKARRVLAARKRAAGEGGGSWVQRFKVKGPYGGVGSLDAATATLLIAGGSGITPILALLSGERHSGNSADAEVATRRVCWALRGTDTGCSLLKAVRGHLASIPLTLFATAGCEEVERILAEPSDGDDECQEGEEGSRGMTRAYFLDTFPCDFPASGAGAEVVPILAAILGAFLGIVVGVSWGGNCEEALLRMEQGWAIGVLNLTYASAFSLACSLLSIFAYQVARHVILGDSESEGDLHLLTPSERLEKSSASLSHRSLGASSALYSSISSSLSSAANLDDSGRTNGKGTSGGSGMMGEASVLRGRPNFGKELKEVFDAAGPAGRVDVVVAGPGGMVKDVRKACTEHPLRSSIRLRICSFEL
mmetsp:Transcript_10976/g.28197  ORF Transcript_10976/g.28197 Transcript_10976/m.28197 type:complete len:767 (-) Transcript_10976:36-2336(-)